MDKRMTMAVAALAAGWTAAAFADGDSFELEPITPEDPGWRISAAIRTAPPDGFWDCFGMIRTSFTKSVFSGMNEQITPQPTFIKLII